MSGDSLSLKLTITLIIVVIIGAFIAGLVIINQKTREEHFSDWENQGQSPPNNPQLPILRTYLHVIDGYWTRDSSSDLPLYICNVGYSVENVGNGDAENVRISIKLNEAVYLEKTIMVLASLSKYADSFTISINYDETKAVSLYAACSKSSDSATIMVVATLPRGFRPDLCKLFITPRDANIVSLKNQIVSNKFPLTPNWIALRDWVANSITYKYDSDVHGVEEYWQLPKETLQLRTGDCEDYAILLVSLLRADGWSPNDVYVVIGKDAQGNGHAWVKVNLGILGWQYLEPQANGWFTLVLDYFITSGYKEEYIFNDTLFYKTG